MKEKFIFIVNPMAGKNNSAVNFITEIKAFINAFDIDGEIYITKCVDDACNFVKKYCENIKVPTRFYACGGDGTLNEVINGAAGCPLASVGILPLGSGNDYIKSLGNKESFLNLEAQIKGEKVKVDLIKIGDRYVINMCNIGFDATVAHNYTKFKAMPGVSGKMAYTMSVFYCLVNKTSSKMKLIVDDKKVIANDFLLCSVSKGIYCGGQYKTSPASDVSDGFIDICAIKKISRPQFLKFFNLYKKGEHVSNPDLADLVYYFKCKKLTIESDELIPMSLDGNADFLHKSVTFEVMPKALDIILPAQAVRDDDKKTAANKAAAALI